MGRAAVNALRDLLERHDHIVQEVDGQNDFGEDLYVTFSEDSRVTGDLIKVQVKGGISWRRANGYAVPVGQHADMWSDGNVPVLCVVYNPDTKGLYWANATDQLRRARSSGMSLASIGISPNAALNDRSLESFVTAARHYLGRYRGMQGVRTHLGEMAGVEFDPSDVVQHFINEYGEDLIFWQRQGEAHATLLHSDLDWESEPITPESLRFSGGLTDRFGSEDAVPDGLKSLVAVPTVGDVILNMPEAVWLTACFAATHWARMAEFESQEMEGVEAAHVDHAYIGADILEDYVLEQIVDRLEVENEIMARSIEALRATSGFDPGFLDELGTLESNPDVVRQATALTRTNVAQVSPEGLRLAIFYLIDRILVGAPSLPVNEQVTIRWRVSEPG